MKEEIVGLIRDEIEEYNKVTSEFNVKFNSLKFEHDGYKYEAEPRLKNRYIDSFEKIIYKQKYLDIIDICDDTFEHIKELYETNQIPTDIESKYKNIKEISDKEINHTKYYCSEKEKNAMTDLDYDKDLNEVDEITMPVIRILHVEYVKFLDYQRLIKFQKHANLTEEDCISISYYLTGKNLIYFYLKIDKYPVDTLLVKKIMNKFSKKHGIRPEDTLEVFQEYLGNGEESKRIMDHETSTFWADNFLEYLK